jgi:hypothetical protein
MEIMNNNQKMQNIRIGAQGINNTRRAGKIILFGRITMIVILIFILTILEYYTIEMKIFL